MRWKKNQFETAQDDVDEALRLDPLNVAANLFRGTLWENAGDFADAIVNYSAAIRADARNELAYSSRARIRATCADPRFRNGQLAIADATKACELGNWKNANRMQILAAAYAEVGNFGRAIQIQNDAIKLAPESKLPQYRSRLALYNSRQPYREKVRNRNVAN